MRIHLLKNVSPIALFSAFLFTWTGVAQDAKRPKIKERKVDVGIKQTTEDDERLQHGMSVALSVKGRAKIVGTVVRDDGKNVYVRTKPGALPTSVAWNTIEDVERIRLVRDGEILSDQPEIHLITIYNGPFRTTQYYSRVLSPGENEMLSRLAKAENEVARLEYLVALKDRAREDELALTKEQLRGQQIQNELLYQQAQGIFPALVHQQLTELGPLVMPYKNLALFKVNQDARNSPVPFMIEPNPEALQQAQESLALARKNAFYENGRIVAVATEETEMNMEMKKAAE